MERLGEVTYVLRVRRDLIEELRGELHQRNESWADDIVSRVVEEVNQSIENKLGEEVEPEKPWQDMTDKDYRVTSSEEWMEERRSEIESTPACGVGDIEAVNEGLRKSR